MNHEIQTATLERLAATIPAATPVYMLNLLRFRPDGGQEIFFNRYVPAFRAVMAAKSIEGVEPTWAGDVAGFVAGPDGEAWDSILIVRYESLAVFRAIVESDLYRKEAAPHHHAAVIDWRLIAHTEMPDSRSQETHGGS